MMLLRKIHKISTILAVVSSAVTSVSLFLYFVDDAFRLNIFGEGIEPFISVTAALFGTLFVVTTAASVVLSLYFLAESK